MFRDRADRHGLPGFVQQDVEHDEPHHWVGFVQKAHRIHRTDMVKALGAGEGELVWGVVAPGARHTMMGAVLGLTLALVVARVLSSFFFGVSASDPLTYVAVGLLLLLVSAVAAFVPARRIAAIDPMEVLKAE